MNQPPDNHNTIYEQGTDNADNEPTVPIEPDQGQDKPDDPPPTPDVDKPDDA